HRAARKASRLAAPALEQRARLSLSTPLSFMGRQPARAQAAPGVPGRRHHRRRRQPGARMKRRTMRAQAKRISWPMVTRIFTAVMVTAVVVLLFNLARKLDWLAVLESAGAIGAPTLALA